jgi:hypothetical protein
VLAPFCLHAQQKKQQVKLNNSSAYSMPRSKGLKSTAETWVGAPFSPTALPRAPPSTKCRAPILPTRPIQKPKESHREASCRKCSKSHPRRRRAREIRTCSKPFSRPRRY